MPSVHHLCPLRLHDLGEPQRICQKGNGGTRGCGGSGRCDGAGDGPGPLGGEQLGYVQGVGLSTGIVSGCMCAHMDHACACV